MDKTAEFVAGLRWDHVPPAVQEKARMCLVDNLGATIAGTATRVSRICAAYAHHAWPSGQATILMHGQRCAAAGAAFANAAAANGIDSDDSVRYAWGHAGAQIFPVALALTEALGLDGTRLLAATVVGYEVAHRIGRCWHDDHEVYQACGSWGSVASAAVAANLMGLNAEQTGQALGIADYHAPNLPMMRDIDHPAMVKHGIAWGSMTGVMAAELATHGFTGIPSLLSHEKYHDWTADIGDNYLMVDGVAWKLERYACCGWAHAAVQGAKELVDLHHIDLSQIARIVVESFHETARLGTRLPTTTEEAQFNLAWPIAAMLVDGECGPRQTLESRLGDAQIRALARKVRIEESEELNELCRLHALGDPRGRFASIVTIRLKDGRTYCSGMRDGGMKFPAPQWSQDEMAQKFRWLTSSLLDKDTTAAVLELTWRLDGLPQVRQLTKMLS